MACLTAEEIAEDLAVASDEDIVFTEEPSHAGKFGMTAGSGTCTIGSSPELLESHYQSTGEKTDRCKSLEAYDHLARFVSTSGQLKNIGSEMEELRYKLKYVKRKLVAVLEETKLVVEKSPPL